MSYMPSVLSCLPRERRVAWNVCLLREARLTIESTFCQCMYFCVRLQCWVLCFIHWLIVVFSCLLFWDMDALPYSFLSWSCVQPNRWFDLYVFSFCYTLLGSFVFYFFMVINFPNFQFDSVNKASVTRPLPHHYWKERQIVSFHWYDDSLELS